VFLEERERDREREREIERERARDRERERAERCVGDHCTTLQMYFHQSFSG
jgi:hypothetical protein